ncbi:PREDICTED: putative nuclease HARBI1 [Wasmannia auropunctata]|uniref:putative nuclease HARBI1 n=1 Tax=Wasmannia auropunctata TaxID=64793 RepID=UPI0005EF8BC6|nr:PREDICTED: putative nuclease HARBI1 [Wasmannia auropunctata]
MTLYREPISPDQRLLLTLRYLASGDSMMSLKYQYYIAQSTITHIIEETCNALWITLMPIVLKVPTSDKWKEISNQFEIKCNFPHCIGAVDGKHVVIQAPPHSGSTYYNYKSSHSIVLMAICDSDYKFILVDIGATGRQSDGGVWGRSAMGQAFAEGQIDIPLSEEVTEGPVLPYVLVGDETFQLTNYMMRPFPGKGGLTKEKAVFNYRLSRSRRMVECAFGILSSQWRIYKRPINTSMETATKIIQATIVLHNFLRQNDTDDVIFEAINVVDPTCSEVETAAFTNIGNFGSNTYTREASHIRNMFVDYFNNEGALSWQESMLP